MRDAFGEGAKTEAESCGVHLPNASRSGSEWSRQLSDLRNGSSAADCAKRGSSGRSGLSTNVEKILDRLRAHRPTVIAGNGRNGRPPFHTFYQSKDSGLGSICTRQSGGVLFLWRFFYAR